MSRILIVDDSKVIRSLVSLYLRGEADLILELAEDGARGLAAARATLPDFVFTDLNMPEMGGVELVTALRALPGYERRPIVILTTADEAELRAAALAAGADGFLDKPFTRDGLIGSIRRFLTSAG
jgi:two-component system, chemotaxis family, chemotaxis protein CheY